MTTNNEFEVEISPAEGWDFSTLTIKDVATKFEYEHTQMFEHDSWMREGYTIYPGDRAYDLLIRTTEDTDIEQEVHKHGFAISEDRTTAWRIPRD